MSILNTRFKRWAQRIEARRSAGIGASALPLAARVLPLPRPALVTNARCGLLGANTLW
jgi:hypothetical protein